MGCTTSILKFCLFIFNFIFLLAGLCCLGVGVWLATDPNVNERIDDIMQAAEDIESYPSTADANARKEIKEIADNFSLIKDVGIVFAIVGGLIVFVAFLGCCGAVKEWRVLLGLYAIILFIILAVELAAGFYAFFNQHEIENFVQVTLKAYNFTADGKPNLMMKAWDGYMIENKCCGIKASKDEWKESGWYKHSKNFPKMSFPNACCGVEIGVASVCLDTKATKYSTGCYEDLKSKLTQNPVMTLSISCGIAALEIFGIIFACCLCSEID